MTNNLSHPETPVLHRLPWSTFWGGVAAAGSDVVGVAGVWAKMDYGSVKAAAKIIEEMRFIVMLLVRFELLQKPPFG